MLLNKKIKKLLKICLFCFMGFSTCYSIARDLDEIKAAGVLRHIGIPYANFVKLIPDANSYVVTGLDVDLVRGFADYLGVDYQFVKAEPENAAGLLTGQNFQVVDNEIIYLDKVDIQGDLMADGITILEYRKKIYDFSDGYFPSGVWLFARSDSVMQPIQPSGSLTKDIAQVKSQLKGRDVLGHQQTCLDPHLYSLELTGANIVLSDNPDEFELMLLKVLNQEVESTLLDVVDGLAALEKWAGKIKVIGPISEKQRMAAAFRKNSPELRKAFNAYLQAIRLDGRYHQIVKKYYPEVFNFYPDFFTTSEQKIY